MTKEREDTALEIITHGPDETFALGERLGKKSAEGEIYLLRGDLGAGKTVFAKGFGAGLGISSPITSPTFTLMQVYDEGRLPLYHFDAYRISDPDELLEIGCEDYWYGSGVSLIEWPQMAGYLLPEKAVEINIEKKAGENDDLRLIRITYPDRERR